jgi:hypothetical protein
MRESNPRDCICSQYPVFSLRDWFLTFHDPFKGLQQVLGAVKVLRKLLSNTGRTSSAQFNRMARQVFLCVGWCHKSHGCKNFIRSSERVCREIAADMFGGEPRLFSVFESDGERDKDFGFKKFFYFGPAPSALQNSLRIKVKGDLSVFLRRECAMLMSLPDAVLQKAEEFSDEALLAVVGDDTALCALLCKRLNFAMEVAYDLWEYVHFVILCLKSGDSQEIRLTHAVYSLEDILTVYGRLFSGTAKVRGKKEKKTSVLRSEVWFLFFVFVFVFVFGHACVCDGVFFLVFRFRHWLIMRWSNPWQPQ